MNRSRVSTLEMIQIYNDRKRQYMDGIEDGSVRGDVIFPEILSTYSLHEIRNLPFTRTNVQDVINTFSFLGVRFMTMPPTLQEFLTTVRENLLVNVMLTEYKRHLNNDIMFVAFVMKAFDFKRLLEIQRQNQQSNIQDEDDQEEEQSDDEEEPTEYVMPDSLVATAIPESRQTIHIRNEDNGFHMLELTKSVKEHLTEEPEPDSDNLNLVFVVIPNSGEKSYYLSSKSDIRTLLKDRTNIQYICNVHGPSLLDIRTTDVQYDRPLFKMTGTGMWSIPYVFLSQIKSLLESPKQVYIVSNEPVENAIAVASDNVFDAIDLTSSSHCQHSAGDPPYPIYSLFYSDNLVFEEEPRTQAQTQAQEEEYDDADTLVSSEVELSDSDTEVDERPSKRTRMDAGTRKRKDTKKRKNKKTKTLKMRKEIRRNLKKRKTRILKKRNIKSRKSYKLRS